MRKQLYLLLGVFVLFQIYNCASKELSGAKVYIRQDQLDKSRLFDSMNNSSEITTNRIVIFNVDIVMETTKPDTLNKLVIDIANKYNGYVMLSGNTRTSIRVPAKSLNEALNDIERLGKIVSKNVTGSDVSNEYRDLEIRLNNAEKARERYLELLSKAENVEAALKVEKELERLNGEIDLLKGNLNRLSHLSDYSTINVTTRTKVQPGPLGYIFVGIYKVIEKLFVWRY